MPIKYQNPQFDPSKLSRHNIDRQAVDAVPNGALVLDVGCATGFMGEYLIKAKNCTVVGLDVRQPEIAKAKKVLSQAILGDLEDAQIVTKVLKATKNVKFDVILATSLIEHLVHPDSAIKKFKQLLKPGGVLIITTPNIAHWSTRLMLLGGNFDYQEYGLMDNTHLHFFTPKTFRQLFVQNKLHLDALKIDAEGGGFPRISLLLAKIWPNLFAYQMLIVAHK